MGIAIIFAVLVSAGGYLCFRQKVKQAREAKREEARRIEAAKAFAAMNKGLSAPKKRTYKKKTTGV